MVRGGVRRVLSACAGIVVLSCSLLVDDEGLSDRECPAESCLGEDGRQRCVPSISPEHGCACSAGRKWCTIELYDSECVSMDDPSYGCAREECVPCYFEHGRATCDADGACAFSTCSPGYADCDRSADHSCETDIRHSAENCNGCGRDCLARTEGTDEVDVAACVGGACVVTRCNDGWGDCDEFFSNGCEVDVRTNDDNCGACGRTCAEGTSCSGGTCE